MKNITIPIPKGEYYIGDPSYFFDMDDWQKVLKSSGPIYKTKKGRFIGFTGSLGGDGSLYDQQGHEYWIDSGMIGIVPKDLVDENVLNNSNNKASKEKGYNLINFTNTVICREMGDFISFNDVLFDTFPVHLDISTDDTIGTYNDRMWKIEGS